MKKNIIIIAEAGVNHNGNINIAKELIDVAAEAKVDYVKFQTFKAETIVSKSASKASYQISNSENKDETQFEMLKNLELSDRDHFILFDYCKSKNIRFLSTAFDISGLEFLNNLGIDLMKVPSGEITNLPYLKKVSSFGKPIILSTGMASILEIEQAINILKSGKTSINDITVLHCNTAYPTPMNDVNLLAMLHLKNKFNVKVGYSDHTLGIEVPIAASAIGATIIEKHFTINKDFIGPDHSSSLSPDELSEMVCSIRNIEKACSGTGKKIVSNSEKANKIHSRKSIYLNTNIKKGQRLKEDNLIMLRPGDGVSPMKLNKVIGKIANKDLLRNTKLNLKNFD